jgi:hypothetical protein
MVSLVRLAALLILFLTGESMQIFLIVITFAAIEIIPYNSCCCAQQIFPNVIRTVLTF